MSENNIWYLPGPFHQYKEDIKALAKERGLRIIDANATESRENAADDVPDVTIAERQKVLLVGGGASITEIDALRAELESVGLIVESFADQGLARPEGELGPVAERLFQMFEAVNAGVQSLISERDCETVKVKELQQQVDDLLVQVENGRQQDAEAKEIADLKAKLDAAEVTYRVNASKESLEKLVADLPNT